MNRRGVALVVVVVLAIGFGAWWLSALPVEVDPVSPPAPIAERVEVPAPPPPIQPIAPTPTPEPVVVTPSSPEVLDAGATAEVEIEVLGRRGAGITVELVGEGGSVSRPTDVMGIARFTLRTGAWRLTAPRVRNIYSLPSDRQRRSLEYELNQSSPLMVTAPLTRLQLVLPQSWTVRGKVVDSHGEPVPSAQITWPPYGAVNSAFAGADGRFTIETNEESLQLQAKSGASRSMMRIATPAEHYVSLVLEEWTQLKVEGTPKNGSRLFVRVIHGDEIVAVGSDDQPLLVPVGHLNVLARRKLGARVLSGKGQIDARVGVENKLELELSPTPPLTGVVVDEKGNRMPDLGVHIRQVEFVEAKPAALGLPPQKPTLNALVRSDAGVPSLTATTRTNHLGEFTWMPEIGRSPNPIFQVMVVELWQAKADPVLVKLDEAPLYILVEPAPPR